MKNFTLYILIILFLTCGCTKSNLNSDETFSQPSNQEKITNQTISLNKEEPQPQEKEQKKELEENLHPIDKAERDCIAKNMSTYYKSFVFPVLCWYIPKNTFQSRLFTYYY